MAMPLRVAFDLDGTIADMHSVLRAEAEQLFGTDVAPTGAHLHAKGDEDEPEATKVIAEMPLSARQQMQLWEHVKTIENFWSNLPEMEPGIVSRIAKTAMSRRWEVLFLTTRPLVAGETTQIQSQRWLE